MNAAHQPDTEELLDRAGAGDRAARQQLLARHRGRLRQMVALRIDRRMAARVDPSDVVQEALADAAQELSDYLRDRPLPFYPWLRQFAWERLLQLHRFHLQAKRRKVDREEIRIFDLIGDSEAALAEHFVNSSTSPSRRLLRAELLERVQTALENLEPRDREVLVLRYLEQLTSKEIAAVIGISEAAVKTRHRRALERLRGRLDIEPGEVTE
jgi:RNA polymerase sigma-70 factor, ECF subfamily